MSLETLSTHNLSPENAEIPKAAVSFLFVDHSPGNEAEITRQIANSNADIVLQELVGSPEEVRSMVEAVINDGIVSESLEERASLARGLTQPLRDLIWALAGSGKKFHFVDVASETPEYELIRKARVARGTPEYEKLLAESVAAREAVVKEQIDAKRKLYPDSKILVVLGAAHYDVAHTLDDVDGVTYLDPSLEELARARRDQFTAA